MKQIAVYGSLREGMCNSRVIEGAKLLSTEDINAPFEMIDMGSYPGLIRAKEDHSIKIEVYEVDDRTCQLVEFLEGYPSFYNRTPVETSVGPADIYFLNRGDEYGSSARRNLVNKTENTFDWVKHLRAKRNG
jgi:gamma-glutamylcyclotransferase (GGCT)/AIG2-like uncharacterized protein YtfP